MEYMALALVIHFIADFLMQSREMGKNKSVYVKVLLQHVGIQFVMFAVCFAPFVGIQTALLFSFCNAAIHALIDWNVWRLYKYRVGLLLIKRAKEELRNFTDGVYSQHMLNLKVADLASKWKFWEDHWFFATIGFDQMLHMLTLVALISILL